MTMSSLALGKLFWKKKSALPGFNLAMGVTLVYLSRIALTEIYSSRGWVGHVLARFGIEAAYSRLGVVIALTFVGLPFVVRTVQPVLEDLDADQEEAAATLGATPLQ